MYNWHLQQRLNIIHDRFHYNRNQLTQEQLAHPEYFVDHSCNFCYPSQNNPNPQYTAFWNWYTNNTSAYQDTQKTFDSFNQYLNRNTDADRRAELHYLLYTTRFRQQENPDTLVPLILNCSNFTQQFTQNLDILNILQNIEEDDFDTTDEEENNNNLFDEMNRDNNANQFLDLLEQIANQQQVRNNVLLPTFSGGDQDPVEWIDEFERCVEINGYRVADLIEVVKGYLLNEARDWYDQMEANNATRFQSWRNQGNRNFRQSFLTRFRNPGKLLQWRMELNNRLQLPHESAPQYAHAIRKLIKKVDIDAAMPESEKVFHFTKGLRREIASQVTSQLTFQPNATLDQVIEAASRIEKHGQMYPETLVGFYNQSNYSNQVPRLNQYQMPMNVYPQQQQIQQAPMTNTNDALAAILQTLGNLNLNQAPVQNIPNNNNYSNNYNMQRNNQGNRPPRNPAVCYKCRQPGHIARNCPVQQPMNNTVNQTPQPTIQAYAQQVPMQPVTIQPQVQQTYPIMQQVQQQPQVFPQQTIPTPVNNLPPPQNNMQGPQGNNVFVATEQTVQQPQMPVYNNQNQSLNWETHP